MRKYMEDVRGSITKREYFDNGNISGYYPYKGKSLDYIIKSYSTPIALFTLGRWFMTRERFGQTTSTQQSAIKAILWDEHIIELDADTFNDMIKIAENN